MSELTTAYDSSGNAINTAYAMATPSLTITQSFYSMTYLPYSYFKNATFCDMIIKIPSMYWVASRFANNYKEEYANFGLRNSGGNCIGGDGLLRSSQDTSSSKNNNLRPIVTIPFNIKVDTSTGNGTESSMYQLKVNQK